MAVIICSYLFYSLDLLTCVCFSGGARVSFGGEELSFDNNYDIL